MPTLAELCEAIPGARLVGDGTIDVGGLTHDSRQVRPGDLFVALRGARADGYRFVARALERGAAALAGADAGAFPAGVASLQLPAPRADLARLAARIFGDPSAALRLIGVTGTNGKTTVTSLIASMCQAAGEPVGLIGTMAHQVGGTRLPARHTTPEAPELQALLRRMVEAGVKVAAMEVSSIGLAEHRADALRFAVAAFLNLSVDHLDYHGDMAAYRAAKLRLFEEGLVPGGVAIVNTDDPLGIEVARRLPGGRELWRLSLQAGGEAEIRFEGLVVDGAGVRGRLHTPRGGVAVRSPLLGRFNAANLAAAVAAAVAAGISIDAIEAALPGARVAGRLQAVPNGVGLRVLVDYAHTPAALEQVLEALAVLGGAGRLWCVFGCGGGRDPSKRHAMGVAAARADAVIVTTDNPRAEDPLAIAQACAAGAMAAGRSAATGPEAGHTWVELDRARAISHTISAAEPGDTILIAGKGHETYQEVAGCRHDFDDAVVAAAALEAAAAAERGR